MTRNPYSELSLVLLELAPGDKAVIMLLSDMETDSATAGRIFWAKGEYPCGESQISTWRRKILHVGGK